MIIIKTIANGRYPSAKKKAPRGGAPGIREAIKASRRRTRRQGCRGRGVYSHRGFAMDGWQSVEKESPSRSGLSGLMLRFIAFTSTYACYPYCAIWILLMSVFGGIPHDYAKCAYKRR